jgi:hypothetical protein
LSIAALVISVRDPLASIVAIELVLLGSSVLKAARGGKNQAHLARLFLPRGAAVLVVTIAAAWVSQPADPFRLSIAFIGYALSVFWRVHLLLPASITHWRYKHHLVSPLERLAPIAPFGAWLTALAAIAAIASSPITWLLATVAAAVAVQWRGKGEPIPPEVLLWPAALIEAEILLAVGRSQLAWIQVAHSDLFGQLITAQLALGIIPLTLAVAAAQLAVNWLGLRAALAIPPLWIAVSLLVTVASLALDLWLYGLQAISTHQAELAEVLAFDTTLLASLAIVHLILKLEPEAVNVRLTKRLNRDWLQQVQYGHSDFGQRHIFKDRFDAIERVLHQAALKEGDSQIAQDLLVRLRERINDLANINTVVKIDLEERGPEPEVEVAIDSYLAARLQPLINELASAEALWALSELLRFRASLEPSLARRKPIGKDAFQLQPLPPRADFRRSVDNIPTGLLFYSTIATAAISNRLDPIVESAVNLTRAYFRRALNNLPPSSTASSVSRVARGGADVTAGDELVLAIELFLRQIESWARDCSEHSLPSALRMLAWTAEEPLSAAMTASDAAWSQWLARTALPVISGIARVADRAGMRVHLPSHVAAVINKAKPEHVEVAAAIDFWIPDTVAGLHSYDWFVRYDALDLAQDLAIGFPEVAARIAAAVAIAEVTSVARGSTPPDEATPRLITNVRDWCGTGIAKFVAAYSAALDRYVSIIGTPIPAVYREAGAAYF